MKVEVSLSQLLSVVMLTPLDKTCEYQEAEHPLPQSLRARFQPRTTPAACVSLIQSFF